MEEREAPLAAGCAQPTRVDGIRQFHRVTLGELCVAPLSPGVSMAPVAGDADAVEARISGDAPRLSQQSAAGSR